jgi:hypothetical protein
MSADMTGNVGNNMSNKTISESMSDNQRFMLQAAILIMALVVNIILQVMSFRSVTSDKGHYLNVRISEERFLEIAAARLGKDKAILVKELEEIKALANDINRKMLEG